MDYRFVGLQQTLPTPLAGYTVGLGYPAPNQVIYSSAKLENINCILEPTQQSSGLFLGDIISTKKQALLKQHNIKAIMSCGVEAVYNPRDTPTYKIEACKTIQAKDLTTYDISQHFQQTYNFISEQIDLGRNVLIHCHAGVSRSAAILVAYLMRKNTWTLDKALGFVKSKRARAKPNEFFMKLLKDFEETILGPLSQARNKLNQVEKSDSDLLKEILGRDKVVEKENTNTPAKTESSQSKQQLSPPSPRQVEKRSIDKYCFETPKKKPEYFKSSQTIETQDSSEKKSITPTNLKFNEPKRFQLKRDASSPTSLNLIPEKSNLPTSRDLQKIQYTPEVIPVIPQTTSFEQINFRPPTTYLTPRPSANISSQQIPGTYMDYRMMSDNKTQNYSNFIQPATRIVHQAQPGRQTMLGQSRAIQNIQYTPRYSEGLVRPCTKVSIFDQTYYKH